MSLVSAFLLSMNGVTGGKKYETILPAQELFATTHFSFAHCMTKYVTLLLKTICAYFVQS